MFYYYLTFVAGAFLGYSAAALMAASKLREARSLLAIERKEGRSRRDAQRLQSIKGALTEQASALEERAQHARSMARGL